MKFTLKDIAWCIALIAVAVMCVRQQVALDSCRKEFMYRHEFGLRYTGDYIESYRSDIVILQGHVRALQDQINDNPAHVAAAGRHRNAGRGSASEPRCNAAGRRRKKPTPTSPTGD